MLREIDANELGKLSTRGMVNRTHRAKTSRSPASWRMSDIFSGRKSFPGDSSNGCRARKHHHSHQRQAGGRADQGSPEFYLLMKIYGFRIPL
jgi:hypothetical protein